MTETKSDMLVLLTLDEVRRWARERHELAERIAELDRKLAAVALLNPAAKDIIEGQEQSGPEKATNMTAFVEGEMSKVENYTTLAELREAGLNHPVFADRVRRNMNSIYNAVARLERRDAVVKRGGRIYRTDMYRELVKQHGEDWEGFSGGEKEESVPESVLKILGVHFPSGALPGQLQHHLRRNPAHRARLDKNPQYLYTVLSRMVKRSQLRKSGRLYIASIRNEPPSDSSQGGSKPGSRGGSHPPRELFSQPRAARA